MHLRSLAACVWSPESRLQWQAARGGEEFDLYAEKWVEPVKSDMFLKSSELKLEGDPVVI